MNTADKLLTQIKEDREIRAKAEEELKRALTKLSQIEDVLLERLHDVCEAQRGKVGKT